MEERSFKILLLFTAISSLIFLYFYSLYATSSGISISEIIPEYIGRVVRVCGYIKNLYISRNGHTFFRLVDENNYFIDCVVFNSTKLSFNISENERICVLGKVNEWKNKLEIIVSEIEKE